MANRRDDIKTRLLATFRVEAAEHLQAITANLLTLERELPPAEIQEIVEATFREVHTLKGAARSVSLLDVEALCQAIESVLSRVRRGQRAFDSPLVSLLHEGMDGVARLLTGGEDRLPVRELIGRLERAAGEAGARGQEPTVEPPPASRVPPPAIQPADTIRLSTAKLDALLLQIEDLLVPKLAAGERVREAKALAEAFKAGVRGQGTEARDLKSMEAQARDLLEHLTGDRRTLTGVVDDMLEGMRSLRLMPAASVLDLFPRMVRDLAREQGKEVQWTSQGTELEVDRKILEAMKEPMIHLVRNAIDHGIEPPGARVQAGKDPRGRVAVSLATLEGNRIEIRVEDDGRGIDLAQVKAAAVRTRLLTSEEAGALSDDGVLDLIFRSGLSTSTIITDVSGHGLGLAIVKERVERVGGQMRIETRIGAGTTMRMILPATIATFRGLLVQAGRQPFLLPLEAIEQAVRIAPSQIENVEGRQAIRWDGSALSVARLGDILGLPATGQPSATRLTPTLPSPAPSGYPGEGKEGGGGRAPRAPRGKPAEGEKQPCVIVASGGERAGFLVEEILGDREVLVKELRPPLVRVRNVAGAGLLGTGQVVLILRPADLLRSLRETPRPTAPPTAREEEPRRRTILVVDDSITTRTMEKSLLEAAGYQVRVAVDGIEAWTLLKSEQFDLVVSDVDMPRMNGFDLTARIRADRELADLPVVLVTALEAREDKERGIEVGANAYIVKSSFDQSNLLEIIRRLI